MNNYFECWNYDKGFYKVWTNQTVLKNALMDKFGMKVVNTYLCPNEGASWDFIIPSSQLKEVVSFGRKMVKNIEKEEIEAK